jgi:hypothetical protein
MAADLAPELFGHLRGIGLLLMSIDSRLKDINDLLKGRRR